MKAVEGRDDAVQGFCKKPDSEVVTKRVSLELCRERQAVSWTLTLSIFLHAGVHTPVSVLLFEEAG